MSSSVLSVSSCFCVWTLLYCMLCLLKHEQSWEYNCRIVTVIHGITSCTLCLYCGLYTGPWPFDALGEPSTSLQTFCITITLGYFLFDFAWCILMQTEGTDMLLHHLTSVCGLVVSLCLERSGAELIATILGSEISNPSLQMRWFFRHSGRYDTRIARLNDVVFIALFLVIRIGLGALLLFRTLVSPRPHILIKLGGVSLYTISVLWMILILKYARKRFFSKRKT